MALNHYVRPYQRMKFLVRENIITLSNATIKTYLPNLWRWNCRNVQTRGYIDLESHMMYTGPNTHFALFIVLNALKDSETGAGVSTELKTQLDIARANFAAVQPDPESATERIFRSVARLLNPRSGLGRHNEMAYAMSEWCTNLVADDDMEYRTIFKYIIDLDTVHANVTSLLNCLLPRWPLTPAMVEDLLAGGYFGRATTNRIERALKTHGQGWVPKSRGRVSLGPDTVPGYSLSPKELVGQWHDDLESTLDLRPKRHMNYNYYDEDDGLLAYDDSRYGRRLCMCPYLGYNPMRLTNEPFPTPRRPHPLMIAAPPASPIPLGHSALLSPSLAVRPPLSRFRTASGLL